MTPRIEMNPEICNGKPVIHGTRITVDTVLSYLCAGDSVEDVMVTHPQLERLDILSCIDAPESATLPEGWEEHLVNSPSMIPPTR